MFFKGRHLTLAQTILVIFPSFILFGYNQVGVGGLLAFESWTQTFPEIDTTHIENDGTSYNSVIQGVYVSSFTLGALVGAFSCSVLGDWLGRRKTIFIGACLTLIGEIISCTSFHLPQLTVGRIITGLGVGELSTITPVWQSECSPAINRGAHVVVDGIFITSGYMVSSWINYGFSHVEESSVSWRVPLAIPCVFSIMLMASIFFFPESPRWLVSSGRRDGAAHSLARIKQTSPDDPNIRQEVSTIELSLEETSRTAATMKDIFTMKDGKLFYRFMLCMGLQFFIHMTGANVISTYVTTIFQQDLGLSSDLSRILAGCALTWKFLASFVAFFTIDRFGRRKLFLFTGTGLTLCMTGLAITNSLPDSNKPASIFSVIFIFLFNFFFPIGFLGTSFLYCTEVAPVRLRVATTSISTANHWLWNFVVQMITPVALAQIGYKYYIVYALIAFCFPIAAYFFYPETMGQSLEKIEELFQRDISVFETVSAARRMTKWPELDGQVGDDTKTKVECIEDSGDEKQV
ncbi:general substrate transporter [Aspergillus steynii IBT 23096]|uniref:General substrate transporter n=1 Tax=Aspergillus steynii IBT 23096 TaxID=1392250 RepID=A0A2I2FRV3_9EURO|nr:general substrate transporter [Aspergillus steynii IBT 23096]PLB43365.1 general substrate transporter [Aspergillus steynii IBT 23096]